MNSKLIAVSAVFAIVTIAEAREPEEWWSRQRGITEGILVEGSVSPDKKYALFEFHKWEGQTSDSATTATGVGIAPADRSKLLFIIDSRTKWMTDKKVTSFLTFKWNDDSTLLATHDSGAKHSKLNIYRIPNSGSAVSLEVPDLLTIATKKLGIPTSTVSSSGQTPIRWRTPHVLEVSVGVNTLKGKLTTIVPLHIDAEGKVSTQWSKPRMRTGAVHPTLTRPASAAPPALASLPARTAPRAGVDDRGLGKK
ncbi:MAG: hypothetical protein HC904_00315 [Blastochloris sp.]|nr:hypothetical protein [Blastochloris sp.]